MLTGESVTSAASTAINVSSLGRTPGEPVGAPDRRSGVLGTAFGCRCCLLLLRPWITLAHVLVQLSVAAHKAERLEDLLVATDVLEPLELILGEPTLHSSGASCHERANLHSVWGAKAHQTRLVKSGDEYEAERHLFLALRIYAQGYLPSRLAAVFLSSSWLPSSRCASTTGAAWPEPKSSSAHTTPQFSSFWVRSAAASSGARSKKLRGGSGAVEAS